jgi:CelD/BcsL family acetyltransferase involved in cellulose biosynthesis
MMKIVPVDPYSDARWTTFIGTHRRASIFHHPNWMRVLQDTYRFRPACRLFVEGENVVGILPILQIRSPITGNRGVCLPFSDICGPLIDREEGTSALGQTCADLCRDQRWKYLDIHEYVGHPGALPTEHYKWHAIILDPDAEKVYRTFRRTSVRQAIEKAERDGTRIEKRTDIKALDEFIRLNELNRRKHGIPPQPAKFFRNLFRHVIANGQGVITLSRCNGQVMAAGIFLHFNKVLVYKYGAVDERFLHMHSTHLMVWNMVKWGCENGYDLFDFGRTDVQNRGLLEFKSRWGAVCNDLHYVRFGQTERAVDITAGGLQRRLEPILRKTPMPVLRLLGQVLYRHIG